MIISNLNLTQLVNWTGLKEKCSGEGCCVRNLNRSLIGRKNGVRIGDNWYCSADCFREGVEVRIRELRHRDVDPQRTRAVRLPLGLLLVSRGCITQDQLRSAVERQKKQGGALGRILCDLGFATERQVAEAGATQWGCPVYSAKGRPSEIQARIPSTLLRLAAMAPVYHATAANRLLIGFVHGIEHQVLRAVEQMTSCFTDPCLITATECRDSIRSLAGRNTEVAFDGISSLSEIANIVQSYAFQIGSDEARFTTCRDRLWIRLNRDSEPTDLLFSASREKSGDAGFENDVVQS